jgi:xanthine dehydrogenase accessory factor
MMKQLFSEIAGLISRQESFVLATVITRNGSAPRSSGAKMLVRQDGTTAGTVGGGILEAQVEQLAMEVQRDHRAVVQSFQFTGKDATTMDAICGGQVEVLVEQLDASDPALAEIFTNLNAAIAGHHKTWLVTELPSNETDHTHALVHEDGTLLGVLPSGLSAETVIEIRQPILVPLDQKEYFIEPLDIAGTVYIFGAGHVSRSLAEFTKMVGFWTVVLDDRADYACAQRFPIADQLIVLDSFSEALKQIEVDRDSYVVIVTRGHLHDRTVLAQALRTPAGYIGMIGSHRKCGLIFDELRRQGFTDGDIQRVHAPIGLPIDAETPEEIGVSIVAEMIQVRAKMRD